MSNPLGAKAHLDLRPVDVRAEARTLQAEAVLFKLNPYFSTEARTLQAESPSRVGGTLLCYGYRKRRELQAVFCLLASISEKSNVRKYLSTVGGFTAVIPRD